MELETHGPGASGWVNVVDHHALVLSSTGHDIRKGGQVIRMDTVKAHLQAKQTSRGHSPVCHRHKMAEYL